MNSTSVDDRSTFQPVSNPSVVSSFGIGQSMMELASNANELGEDSGTQLAVTETYRRPVFPAEHQIQVLVVGPPLHERDPLRASQTRADRWTQFGHAALRNDAKPCVVMRIKVPAQMAFREICLVTEMDESAFTRQTQAGPIAPGVPEGEAARGRSRPAVNSVGRE